MFGFADWSVLGLYLLGTAFLGFWFSKKNNSASEYLFGGGKMPWYAVGLSLIATSVSATSFLGGPADVYKTNMTYLMLQIGGFISIVVIGWVFIPKLRALQISSGFELLEQKFSLPVRKLAAALYCLHLLLRSGVLLYGPALVLAQILDINLYFAISLTAFLAITYTYAGGIQAVIWTDVVQFVILIGGGLFVLFFIGNAVENPWQIAAAAGKTQWLDTHFDLANARTLFNAGLVYAVFEIAIRGCDQQFIQRYLSCKSVKEANYSSIFSAICGLGVTVLFFTVGAYLFAYYQSFPTHLPAETGVNEVFPLFILRELPSGFKGLLVAAIYAAAMSSLDSAMTALANTTVMDFKGFGKEAPVPLLKKWVVVWGVLGTSGAYLCAYFHSQSLLSMTLYFTSLFTGPLLGLFLFAFFARKKYNQWALLLGVLLGMCSLFFFSKPPFASASWTPLFSFSWPWNPVISLSVMVLSVFLGQKISEIVLKKT